MLSVLIATKFLKIILKVEEGDNQVRQEWLVIDPLQCPPRQQQEGRGGGVKTMFVGTEPPINPSPVTVI